MTITGIRYWILSFLKKKMDEKEMVHSDFQNLFINFIGCEDFMFHKICLNGINLKRLKAVQHGKIADICAVWLRALVFQGW